MDRILAARVRTESNSFFKIADPFTGKLVAITFVLHDFKHFTLEVHLACMFRNVQQYYSDLTNGQ